MTAPSVIKRHLDEALFAEPRTAVIAVRRLLEEDLPWLEQRVVHAARAEGYSWAKLGRLLGRSRQAVRQRFGGDDTRRPSLPVRPVAADERIIATWNRIKADARRRAEFEHLSPTDVVPW
jgi:hypothetical protein